MPSDRHCFKNFAMFIPTHQNCTLKHCKSMPMPSHRHCFKNFAFFIQTHKKCTLKNTVTPSYYDKSPLKQANKRKTVLICAPCLVAAYAFKMFIKVQTHTRVDLQSKGQTFTFILNSLLHRSKLWLLLHNSQADI